MLSALFSADVGQDLSFQSDITYHEVVQLEQ